MSIQIIEVEIPVAGITEITVQFGGGGGGVTDHGALTGLGDDDHTQYAKSDGTRGAFAAPLGTDDNYVTDAEKVKLANTTGVNTGDQTSVTGNAGTVTTINGLIAAGTNVTLTGAGTAASPYNIAAAAPVDAITDGNLSPVTSNAVFDGLALKAPLESPSFTGGITVSGSIGVQGDYQGIVTAGTGSVIYTAGPGAAMYTSGDGSHIFTSGINSNIQTGSGQFIGAGTGLTGTAAGLTSGTVSTINGLIAAGTNVTLTGAGTGASPYTIASGGATRYFGTGTTAMTTSQSGSMIVNAGGARTFTLPAGAAGLMYIFKCETGALLTIKTGTTELIKHGTLTTVATTGVLTASTAGSIITVAWDGTYWQTTAATHNWAVDGVTLTDLPAGNLSGDIAVARIATALTAPGPIGGTTPAAITGTTGTFSGAGAANAAAMSFTGAPYVAGTATSNHPLHYQNGGTAPTSWSAAGTYTGTNAVSGFTGNFLDYHVNGGVSLFKVSSAGDIVTSGTISAGIYYGAAGSNGLLRLDGNTSARGLAIGSLNVITWASGAAGSGISGVTTLSSNSSGIVQFGTTTSNALGSWLATNGTLSGTLSVTGDVIFGKTITGSGTTGNVTINKTSGSARFPAASAAGLVVTNSLCTVNSVIQCTIGSNDTTCKAAQVVAGAGSFTIYPGATTTSECIVYFSLTN